METPVIVDPANKNGPCLFLRKVIHPSAGDNYRVVVHDGDEIEIGSIGRQFDGWTWGIDCVIPMRDEETEGSGKDRKDCMRQFRAAWDRFSSDPARLTEFSRNEAEAAAVSAARISWLINPKVPGMSHLNSHQDRDRTQGRPKHFRTRKKPRNSRERSWPKHFI
jgi:hypothetical protein